MNWRALLLQPAVMTAITSMIFGGGSQAPNPAVAWLNRAAAVFGILATIMALIFGWVYFETRYPLEDAALFYSLSLALICAICVAVAYGIAHFKKVRSWIWRKKAMEKIENTADFALNEIEAFGRDHPKTAVLLSALVGYILAGRAVEGTERILAALDLTDNDQHEGD